MVLAAADVLIWAIQRTQPVTVDAIRARWTVSRATAYRWRPTLEDVRQRVQRTGVPRAIPVMRVPTLTRQTAVEVRAR